MLSDISASHIANNPRSLLSVFTHELHQNGDFIIFSQVYSTVWSLELLWFCLLPQSLLFVRNKEKSVVLSILILRSPWNN